MTLILITLTRRGAVIAADRRTLTFNNATQKEAVLTEHANKVIASSNIAMVVKGDTKGSNQTGEDVLGKWLRDSYNAKSDFEQQLTTLYNDKFKNGELGEFIAIALDNDQYATCSVSAKNGLEFQKLPSDKTTVLKYFGSGNLIASDLVNLIKPPLDGFNIQELVNFSTFIIQSTHAIMFYQKSRFPSVGSGVSVAVITKKGSKLIHGGEIHIDSAFPRK